MKNEDFPLVAAKFVCRNNRFVLQAELESGETVTVHLADPGRLEELLIPGAAMRLRESSDPRRKTRWSAIMVQAPGPDRDWVSLQPSGANQLAEIALRDGVLSDVVQEPAAWTAEHLQREVRHEVHRFDFQLAPSVPEHPLLWIEVKSVSWLIGETLLFPDAPSIRAAKHLDALAERLRCGDRALLIWVIQRSAGRQLKLAHQRDPGLARSFARAQTAGLEIAVLRYRFSPDGSPERLLPLPFLDLPTQKTL